MHTPRGLWCLAICLTAALAAAGERPTVDAKASSVRIPAVAAKQGVYKQLKGAIEYVLVAEGGKAYESLFTTPCTPIEIAQALAQIGLKPGTPATEDAPPRGQPVRILAEYQADGKTIRRAVDVFVRYLKGGQPLKTMPWTFTGSKKGYDPAADKETLEAAVTKSIVGLHFQDASPLFQNPRPEARKENIYTANLPQLPAPGSAVVIIFERVVQQAPAGARRIHVFVSGRVQGVGFRAFTQREARRLKLAGWVKNLADGRVEAVVQGPAKDVATLLDKMRRGPRAARVQKLDATPQPAEGALAGFEIRY